MATSILGVIQHYQRSIENSQDDETRLLHCINKLYKLPVKVEHLQETGIGKTVNSLRKYNGEIGVAAKALVTKWKAMVAAEEEPTDTQCQSNDAAPTPASGRESSDDDSQQQRNHNSTHAHSSSHSGSSHRHRSSDKEKHHKDRENRKEGESSSSNERHSSKSRHHRSHSRHQDADGQHKQRDREETSEQNDHHRQRHNNESSKEKEKHRSHSEKDAKETATAKESNSGHKSSSDRNGAVKGKEKEREKRHRSKEHHHSQKNGVHEEHKKSHKHIDSKKHSSSKEREKHSGDKPKDDKHSVKSTSNEREKQREKDREHRSNHKSSSQSRSSNHKASTSSNATAATPTSTSTTNTLPINAKVDNKRSHHVVDSDNDEPVLIAKKAKIQNHSKHKDSEKDGVGHVEPEDGIDSSMGANFADVLGMLNMPSKKTKKSANALKSPNASVSKTVISTTTSSTTTKRSGDSTKTDSVKSSKTASTSSLVSTSTTSTYRRSPPDEKPALLTSAAKLEPLDPSIVLDLPAISLHYKPLPVNQTVMDCVYQNFPTSTTTPKQTARTLTDAEALSHGISSKTMRTKIYSGVKTGQIHQVPSLFDLCIRVLQKNIDALEYTGGVPFEVLRPVLERATPQQLLNFEDYNPYLMEDSDVLWQLHVQRNYRNKKREEMESWREMYLRCQEEEQQKLNTLTQTIRQSQKIIAAPVRKTQLAFVDSMVKPPRNVQRKQEQYGTKSKLIATPASRVAALSSVTPNAAKVGDARLRVAATVRDAAQVSHAPVRPKKAPLMAKTLQFMRGRHKR